MILSHLVFLFHYEHYADVAKMLKKIFSDQNPIYNSSTEQWESEFDKYPFAMEPEPPKPEKDDANSDSQSSSSDSNPVPPILADIINFFGGPLRGFDLFLGRVKKRNLSLEWSNYVMRALILMGEHMSLKFRAKYIMELYNHFSQWLLGMSEPELKETPKLEFKLFIG